jgi:AI-2 transport protein TqsA
MPRNTPTPDQTPPVQAPPDVPPVAGQPQAPPLFGILLLAGLVIVGVGLKSTANIVGPVFLVLTLVITVSPLRRWLMKHSVPSALASILSLLAIYLLLVVILGSVVYSIYRLPPCRSTAPRSPASSTPSPASPNASATAPTRSASSRPRSR